MRKYRFSAFMTGLLYLLGTVYGILSAVVGGEVVSSLVQAEPLLDVNILEIINDEPRRLHGGAFLVLLMGISLMSMTLFLYPVFKKDNEELALGMIIFRGVMEGVWYLLTALVIIGLFVLGKEYVVAVDSSVLESFGNILYNFQDLLGPIGTIFFLIGATCLYVSFYRTQLLPRWLTIWGFIGIVPYFAYAILHLFRLDNGIGFYLQMILAPQEIVMALWLMIKGFNANKLDILLKKSVT